jgi:murein DD-endopeptidase MepM/ murein hydrolase activator NlpD
MKSFTIFLIGFFAFNSCNQTQTTLKLSNVNNEIIKDSIREVDVWKYNENYIAFTFDYPVGKTEAEGYYNAQPFTKNFHLGEDWNGNGGGNTDFDDPIYAIGNGYVKSVKDEQGGWGNVIRMVHKLPNGTFVESLYAHCNTILTNESQWIKKGTQIGTIGTAHDAYIAHLHLEIRDIIDLPLGSGYSSNTYGYLNPTQFIEQHR